jgi:hypothetical protein
MSTGRCTRALAGLAAVTVSVLGAGVGIARAAGPTAATPPRISGTGVYDTTLTCNNGTWSAGAGSYTYTWELADGNIEIGSGTTLRIRASWVGFGIVCAVSAKDSTGTSTSTSPPVTASPATPKIVITRARQTAPHKITIRGHITPRVSLNGGAGSLILYRVTSAGIQQLSFNGPQTRPNKKTGAFLLVASSEPVGRHTYIVQYVPSALGYAPQVTASRKIRVRSK